MATDAADKAHSDKVKATADGERLVAHSTFTEGDRELRTVMDEAEADRVAAYQEAGHVASPLTGDYHAARRAGKQAAALLEGIGGNEPTDASAMVVEGVRGAMDESRKVAGAARRAAGQNRQGGPQGRRSRSEAMNTGTTGGLNQGDGEGVGKSASSTGTDTTDRGMDSSVGDQPPSVGGKPQDSDQDRPETQPKAAEAHKPGSARTGRGSTGSSNKS